MKTQYYAASSLDGFIATEDHSLEWLFPLGDLQDSSYPAFVEEVGALAMGSSTYAWILRQGGQPGADPGALWPYTQPTWVFSSRPQEGIPGAAIRFVHGDVRPVHEAMKLAANGKSLWIVGGGDLAGQFYDAGLLDELIIQVGSVTLGQGKPLLPRRIVGAAALRLREVQMFGPGLAELRYDVPPRR
jgi:dihydrofolate reductase